MRAHFTLFAGILANIIGLSSGIAQDHCATMPRLDSLFEKNISLKNKFEAQRNSFNARLQQRRSLSQRNNAAEITYTIPVVFHIVLPDPSVVTNAQLQAQLEVLNHAFSGTSADSSSIPSWFKPLFGKSHIRFCLAQRTPEDAPSTGITRTTTGSGSFTYDDKVKYSNSGGIDSWNINDYFNVWICRLSNNLLGYGTFPDDGNDGAQGVVIDYRTLPGGSYQDYNTGKTLCHETGHYFNLYHIWGDDDGACTGTDYVDDTPNQANSSSGCNSGIITDKCTPGGNGILYQDYMDYSNDNCLIMFTTEQVERMESALTTYRSSLLSSQGCTPVNLLPYDAAFTVVYAPAQRICTPSFSPLITIKNKGTETLTFLNVNVLVNGQKIGTYQWTGSLPSWDTATITLPQYNIGEGNYMLTIRLTDPNGQADNDTTNNVVSAPLQYYSPVAAIQESFEGDDNLPAGWDIINNNSGAGWQKTDAIASTGITSMNKVTDDYGNGEKSWLRMREVYFTDVDSAYLTFTIAAAPRLTAGSIGYADTLEVLLSQDCGSSYKSLYKKYNASLNTSTTVNPAFRPAAAEWRKDTVNLLDYINKGNVMLAFRITNYNQSSIYIDDVNVFTVTVNPNLKAKGFMVTPNPTSGKIEVQFYPAPDKLQAVQVYTVAGQLIRNIATANGQSNLYTIDLSPYPAGIYMVRAVFSNQVLIKKIIKN